MNKAGEQAILHRAPWVVPVLSPPLADGSVLTQAGRIQAVGHYPELAKGFSGMVQDHEEMILCPALVNCHAHLELSHVAKLGAAVGGYARPGAITAWIRELLALLAAPLDPEAVQEAARAARARLHETGTVLVADVGNRLASEKLWADGNPEGLFFLELIGLAKRSEEALMARLASEIPATAACTAHAPYSVSPLLLRQLKERAKAQGRLFPIHVAESVDEIRFLADGTGSFREFLEERGAWDGSFVSPTTGAVAYLERLGLLDPATLCVHSIHVSEQEMDLLAERQAKVVLCPASNRYLGVGRAPVAGFLARGLLPGLGTDSLASNGDLSLWREMQVLRQEHPHVSPEVCFTMATLGGARALGRDNDFGALAPGLAATFLAVQMPGAGKTDIFEILTGQEGEPRVAWFSPAFAGKTNIEGPGTDCRGGVTPPLRGFI